MNDIIITRKAIKDIAEHIYNDVDSYDYQDSGYTLKDIEIAVANTLSDVVDRITTSFEDYALGACVMHGSSWAFRPRRLCDAGDCEMPVRSNDDIWCYRHGEIEDKRQAEAEVFASQQFSDLDF